MWPETALPTFKWSKFGKYAFLVVRNVLLYDPDETQVKILVK